MDESCYFIVSLIQYAYDMKIILITDMILANLKWNKKILKQNVIPRLMGFIYQMNELLGFKSKGPAKRKQDWIRRVLSFL